MATLAARWNGTRKDWRGDDATTDHSEWNRKGEAAMTLRRDSALCKHVVFVRLNEGRDFLTLLERFTGAKQWDDAATLKAAYERYNAVLRQTIPPHRLLEW